jgi:coproporphyrinogen III oxidase-like Fe-S oxidoreductase
LIPSIFGGGTPSLLSENHLDQLFNAIESNLNLRNIQEITLRSQSRRHYNGIASNLEKVQNR